MRNSQFAIAIHILTVLAENAADNVKSECIAESVNTNAVVIRRLLSHLNQAKLVVSQTGSTGGTRLAKETAEINLAEVFRAVSTSEVFSLHRQKPNQNCPVGKNIEAVLCKLQKEVDETIEKRLANYSLHDVIEMMKNQPKN